MWGKSNNLLKKESDSGQVYNGKYIKAKIGLYNVNFYGNLCREILCQYIFMPRENEHCTCLSVILLDSVVNAGKKYPGSLCPLFFIKFLFFTK